MVSSCFCDLFCSVFVTQIVGGNGTITNRGTVDGQVYGGLVQGIGLALTEDFEDLKKHTTLIGSGFPFIKEMPDNMELMYVETPCPDDFQLPSHVPPLIS